MILVRKRLFCSLKHKNYYQRLDIKHTASIEEIKTAYQTKIKKSHPDLSKQGSTEEFQEIRKAFGVLSDSKQRRVYDDSLSIKKTKEETNSEDSSPMFSEMGSRTEHTTEYYRNLIRNRTPKTAKERQQMKNDRSIPLTSESYTSSVIGIGVVSVLAAFFLTR